MNSLKDELGCQKYHNDYWSIMVAFRMLNGYLHYQLFADDFQEVTLKSPTYDICRFIGSIFANFLLNGNIDHLQ